MSTEHQGEGGGYDWGSDRSAPWAPEVMAAAEVHFRVVCHSASDHVVRLCGGGGCLKASRQLTEPDRGPQPSRLKWRGRGHCLGLQIKPTTVGWHGLITPSSSFFFFFFNVNRWCFFTFFTSWYCSTVERKSQSISKTLSKNDVYAVRRGL